MSSLSKDSYRPLNQVLGKILPMIFLQPLKLIFSKLLIPELQRFSKISSPWSGVDWVPTSTSSFKSSLMAQIKATISMSILRLSADVNIKLLISRTSQLLALLASKEKGHGSIELLSSSFRIRRTFRPFYSTIDAISLTSWLATSGDENWIPSRQTEVIGS